MWYTGLWIVLLIVGVGLGVLALSLIMRPLRSTGNLYDLHQAIGCVGTVYHSIPRKGRGKISIALDAFRLELDAISVDGEPIAAFTSVVVIRILTSDCVVVQRS
jgi:hypothetical protein